MPRGPGDGPPRAIVPLFLLYDYSFAPDEVGPEGAVVWAAEGGVRSADEELLAPASVRHARRAWCHARVADARGPAGAAAPRRAVDPGQPLPAARGPGGAAAHPAVHDLVRDAAAPRTGTAASTWRRWSTATCTCAPRAPSTACASTKCRSATRGSGTGAAGLEHYLRRIL